MRRRQRKRNYDVMSLKDWATGFVLGGKNKKQKHQVKLNDDGLKHLVLIWRLLEQEIGGLADW